MTRIGLGFDAHAFDADRRLILGGVEIPDSPGLSGHSDADVLAHAVADALLGAAGLGDLGSRFPPTDEWKDADSIVMLKECADAVRGAGYRVVNVDATVIAQRPRLAPHTAAMADKVAWTLDVEVAAVGVKATTTDHMGFTGRGEGIAALAVVSLEAS